MTNPLSSGSGSSDSSVALATWLAGPMSVVAVPCDPLGSTMGNSTTSEPTL